MEKTVERKQWLDGLRAIAMLLVIAGHLLPEHSAFFALTNPVKLPLFFAISGYLFKERSPAAFFAGLLRRLVVPWLLAVLALALVRVPSRGASAIPATFREAVALSTLWYILCCAEAEALWYGLRRLCPGDAATALGAALLSAAGVAMARLNVLNALMINRAFIAQAYMLIGFLFRRREQELRRLPRAALAAAIACYAALWLVNLRVWPDKCIDVHLNRYFNLPFNMLMIWLGCATLLALGSRLDRAPRALTFIGRNTLIFYMLHNYVIRGLEYALARFGLRFSGVPRALLLIPLTCLICAAASLLINRFLPELAGRRRK